MSNELDEYIETSFSHRFCIMVEQVLKYKFPEIKNLTCEMDEEGFVHVIFEETKYTQKEVQDFLAEFRKNGHKIEQDKNK